MKRAIRRLIKARNLTDDCVVKVEHRPDKNSKLGLCADNTWNECKNKSHIEPVAGWIVTPWITDLHTKSNNGVDNAYHKSLKENNYTGYSEAMMHFWNYDTKTGVMYDTSQRDLSEFGDYVIDPRVAFYAKDEPSPVYWKGDEVITKFPNILFLDGDHIAFRFTASVKKNMLLGWTQQFFANANGGVFAEYIKNVKGGLITNEDLRGLVNEWTRNLTIEENA